jgi:hypothetical protein
MFIKKRIIAFPGCCGNLDSLPVGIVWKFSFGFGFFFSDSVNFSFVD